MIRLFPIFLFFVLISCEASYGDKYTVGNLEIYYTDEIREEFIIGIGDYFKENGLIQDRKHSVQITRDYEGFILKMILNEEYDQLPEEQKTNLELLEEDMKHVIFENLNFRIEVTDRYFKPIETKE